MVERTISTYFGDDHDRLDELFKKFRALKRTDFEAAKDCFMRFKSGLHRHIIWEEEILFPIFEDRTGMRDRGPTAVMRLEHRTIKQYLEAIHGRVREGNPDTDADEERLLNSLLAHNQKEEQILYPAIDASLKAGEQESVFAAMDKVAEQ